MAESKKIFVYDTTLRDGSQAEEVNFSLMDKLRITEELDGLGIHYIEGGWPGSNPKDEEFFKEVRKLSLKLAKITAFGATCRYGRPASEDNNIRKLIDSKTPVVTLFGKTWDFHVRDALKISLKGNLEIIRDSVAFIKSKRREVVYDAEHFFDGYKANREFAMKTLQIAEEAGADWIVLCDTNGGSMPLEIGEMVEDVKKRCKVPLGIHCHNDGEMGVANTIIGIQKGVTQVQGTINGIGERCGNANLCSIIANVMLKLNRSCISKSQMKQLTPISRFVSELANQRPWRGQPYVGKSAFAHKGGIHINAVMKNPLTYEHVTPESVGNIRRILVSDLSGRSSILQKAEEFGIKMNSKDPNTQEILKELKDLEHRGYQFEGAEGSFEMLMRKAQGHWKRYFEVVRAHVIISFSPDHTANFSEAAVKIRGPNGQEEHAVAEGNGPVNALDTALRKALKRFYPELEDLRLHDFKVRILDEKAGTAAKTRVLIESGDDFKKWGTVGVSENIIEASWKALVDSVDYKLHQKNYRNHNSKNSKAKK